MDEAHHPPDHSSKKRMNHKFTHEEDMKLKKLVNNYGESAWDEIAALMDGRNPRQCHDRWCSYLSPSINNSPWTPEEDKRIIKLQPEFNGKWVQMSKRFKGRTDIQLRNRWNILKKSMKQPVRPKTQIPKTKSVPSIKDESPPKNTETTNLFPNIFDQLSLLFADPDPEDPTFSFQT